MDHVVLEVSASCLWPLGGLSDGISTLRGEREGGRERGKGSNGEGGMERERERDGGMDGEGGRGREREEEGWRGREGKQEGRREGR